MPSSSDTRVSDTLDPMAVVSDDKILSEREVYTSDTTSTDDVDFQPFALPDVGVEPADGIPAGDLPHAVIPAPTPLAAFPVVDIPLDVVSDDDIDLFEEDLLEADYEGRAPIVANVILPIAEAPVEELPVGSPVPDSFECVASVSLHDQSVQHHSPDTDPDLAMSAAPGLAHEFEFDHEVDDNLDPDFPPDFDPNQEIEFIHLDQPLEAPVAPIDPLFYIPADFNMDLVDPEPVMAPEPVVAPNPAIEHDPGIPPPRPGEGSSRQPPVSAPPVLSSPSPFTSQFPHVAPPTAPSFMPSSEPFLWTTPPIMSLSDPYHPYHVGYSTEDILTSLMTQHNALTHRIDAC
ncbi:serine/threonine-protein kinase WNK2-like [Helianthus annuus]|uniref:serine/threonine-protein kinase WNK2-like n=1 Tax=Helianthus annuus TaxID=4232 RepID=UPI000B9002B9|nr:serine/threonine-protein kinase WNK2-like [Helianthus annuus]